LAPLPDVHPTYLIFDDGSIRFWIEGGGGTSIFTTIDFMSFRPSPVAGHVSPVLGPRQPQSKAFDSDYAGGSSIFPAANKTDLMMIYHASLLAAWRRLERPIVHIRHDSTDPVSPYRPGQVGNDFKSAVAPNACRLISESLVCGLSKYFLHTCAEASSCE
jgi:hypothetical protein